MKEIILFDIDYTLINSAISKEIRREYISKEFGLDIDEIIIAEKGYIPKDTGFTDFNPNDFVSHLSNTLNADVRKMHDIFFDDSVFLNALYPEVITCLESLSGNYSLGIFSEGFRDFQLTKLHKSGIINFFKKDLTFISRRKLTESTLSLIPYGSYILDDNPEVIAALHKVGIFEPIWVNRNTKEEHGECKTIFDLFGTRNILGYSQSRDYLKCPIV